MNSLPVAFCIETTTLHQIFAKMAVLRKSGICALKFRLFLAIALPIVLSACSVARLPESFNTAVLNNPDMATVEAGLPAYLLTLDGMVVNYPENVSLLQTSSTLYGAYATLFVAEPERRRHMVSVAYQRASAAYCAVMKSPCDLKEMRFDAFEQHLTKVDKDREINALYILGSSWVGVIQENSNDWNAIADLAKVQTIMEKVAAVDPTYDNGQVLLYLGVLNTLIPPSLGGKPEVAHAYFTQAMDVTEGRNLLIPVMFARHYARLVFDQALHDSLLQSVIDADPETPGLWLQNVYAQKLARELLASSVDYF